MVHTDDPSALASPDGYASNDEELYWTLPPLSFVQNVRNQSSRTTKSGVSSQNEPNADGTVDAGVLEDETLLSQRPSFCFRHAAITELELAASALGVTAPSHEQYMKAVQFGKLKKLLLVDESVAESSINSEEEDDTLNDVKGLLSAFSTHINTDLVKARTVLLKACKLAAHNSSTGKKVLNSDAERVSNSEAVLSQLREAHGDLQKKLCSGQEPVDKSLLLYAVWLVHLTGETCAAFRAADLVEEDNSQTSLLGPLCSATLSSCFQQLQHFQKWVFSQLLPCRLDPGSVGIGGVLCECWEGAVHAVVSMAFWPDIQQTVLQALHACLTAGASAAATQLASRINREVDAQHSASPTPQPNNHSFSSSHHYGAPPPPPPGGHPRHSAGLSSPPPGLHHPTPFSQQHTPPPPPSLPVITTEDAMDKEAVQMLWCLLWAADSVMAAVPDLTVLPDEDSEGARTPRENGDSVTPTGRKTLSKAGSEAVSELVVGELDPEGGRRAFFELCMSWTRRSEWMGAQLSRMLTKRPDSLDGEDGLVAAILQQRNDVLSFVVQWSTTWLCLTNDPKSTQQMDKLKRHAMKLITHSLEIYTMVSFPMPEPAHAPIGAKAGTPSTPLANGGLPNGVVAPTKGKSPKKEVALANGVVSVPGAVTDKFWSLQWGAWQLIRPLGKGSSAQVWKARYHHADVALKLFQLDSADINYQVQSELDALRHLASHPNVVRFLGACWHTGGNGAQLAVMMEYCNAGTLHNTIDNARQQSRRRNNAKLQHFYSSWVNRLEIAQNVAAAVAFLHIQGTPHRDLTSYNVLLHYSDPWQAKVADLGLARLIAHPDMDLSTLESLDHGPDAHWPAWIAPELFHPGAQYDCRADVYSFGIILWELIMLKHPWEQDPPPPPPPGLRAGKSPPPQQPQPKTKFVPGDHPTFPANPVVLEESMPKVTEVIELAEQCWQVDPAARPTMQAVVSRLDGILSKVQRICKV